MSAIAELSFDYFSIPSQEVVLRFENQGDTQHHLEQLKSDNEKQIEHLKGRTRYTSAGVPTDEIFR